jgi:hypothetical protein
MTNRFVLIYFLVVLGVHAALNIEKGAMHRTLFVFALISFKPVR